jgi:leucyl aminopeptidase
MGGLLAVNQGSAREPRFVVLEHKPAGARGPPFVVVGKGITFDTGGISIKPSERMEDMKFDKSGASAVFGILRACALLKLPQHVVGLTAWTDNMPSGSAYKPGDVVKTLSGKTIEVINTDAEGRVILADALAYAARYDPAAVVELSTLTGGIVIALGNQASGAFANDADLLARVKESAEATRERVWEMPMFEEYGEMVKSKIADVKNSAGRSASSVTAAKFLEAFVGDHPWVHLDIAGTAWCEGSPGFNEEINPGPATGVGVRLLTHLLQHWEGLPSAKNVPPLKPKGRKKRGA